MGQRRTPGVPRAVIADQEMRDREVLRANSELAEYFKGQRTEREARAAVKIIKAFIRDREHADESNRRPLPGVEAAKTPKRAPQPKRTPKKATNRKAARDANERKPRRKSPKTSSVPVDAPDVPDLSERPPE